MNRIITSLSIYFLLITLSAAEPFKLIPGDRSVIKTHGATHTISKYYIVPRDFVTNQANSTNGLLNRIVKAFKSRHLKGAKYDDKSAKLVKESVGNDHVGRTYGVTESIQLKETAEEPSVSVSPINVNAENLGNIDVKSTTSANNISSNITSDIGTIYEYKPTERNDIVYTTENEDTKSNVNDFSNIPPLKNFALKAFNSIDQNLEILGSVLKKYVIEDSSDKDKELIRVNKIFHLLNFFIDLCKDLKLGNATDATNDDLTNLILKNKIKTYKSTESRSYPKNNDKNSTKECMIKCFQQPSTLDLDSKDVSISETDGWESDANRKYDEYLYATDSSTPSVDELNLPLSDSDSKTKPQLVRISDEFNVHYTPATLEDHKLNSNSFDTPKIYRQSRTTENYQVNDIQRTKNLGDTNNQLRVLDQKGANILPWDIDIKGAKNLPQFKNGKSYNNIMWTIRDRRPHKYSKLVLISGGILPKPPLNPQISPIAPTYIDKPGLYAYIVKPENVLYTPKINKSNMYKVNSWNNNVDTSPKTTYDQSSAHGKDSNEQTIEKVPLNHGLDLSGNYKSQLNFEKDNDLFAKETNAILQIFDGQALPDYKGYRQETNLRPNAPFDLQNKIEFETKYSIRKPINIKLNKSNHNIPSGLENEIPKVNQAPIPLDPDIEDDEVPAPVNEIDSSTKIPARSLYNPELIKPVSETKNNNKPFNGPEYITTDTSTPIYEDQAVDSNAQESIPDQPNDLVPTYELLSIDNLIKLHNAIIEAQQYGRPNNVQFRALEKLKKINNLLLILANNLIKATGNPKWYEIVLSKANNQIPLDAYFLNLILQKWLHELMLTLYQNNFNPSILKDPRLSTLLVTIQFPDYVLEFLKTQHNLQIDHVTEDVDADLPPFLVENNKPNTQIVSGDIAPARGIVIHIGNAKAGLDANVIIKILKQYLIFKKYNDDQENNINQKNIIGMLKQVALFLKQKGYQGRVIVYLIQKLYNALFSKQGNKCLQTPAKNFIHTAYNVILPILRRSQ